MHCARAGLHMKAVHVCKPKDVTTSSHPCEQRHERRSSSLEDIFAQPVGVLQTLVDFTEILTAEQIDLFTDSSGRIGCGGIFESMWFQMRWDNQFLQINKPSIEYLELYAVAIAVALWAPYLKDKRICLFCDNESVCKMLNKSSSGCKNCMVLIRMITLQSLIWNVRVFADWISTGDNKLADALSRFQSRRFWQEINKSGKQVAASATPVPNEFIDMTKLWLKNLI